MAKEEKNMFSKTKSHVIIYMYCISDFLSIKGGLEKKISTNLVTIAFKPYHMTLHEQLIDFILQSILNIFIQKIENYLHYY